MLLNDAIFHLGHPKLYSWTCTSAKRQKHTAARCNTLQHAAMHCNALQHTATHCDPRERSTLQHTAALCNTLQHTATPYSTLQHTATHSNPQESAHMHATLASAARETMDGRTRFKDWDDSMAAEGRALLGGGNVNMHSAAMMSSQSLE